MHLGLNTDKKEAAMTELLPVSCSVIFKPGVSFFSGLSCQSVSHLLSNLLMIVSAANPLVSHWRAPSAVILMSQNSVALSAATLLVCGKGTDLLKSVFARLSLPASLVPSTYLRLGQSWSRIFAAFCVQPVYTTVRGCIHRDTVGTHALAACSNVTANTTAVPCTVSVHTPTVLSGYFV